MTASYAGYVKVPSRWFSYSKRCFRMAAWTCMLQGQHLSNAWNLLAASQPALCSNKTAPANLAVPPLGTIVCDWNLQRALPLVDSARAFFLESQALVRSDSASLVQSTGELPSLSLAKSRAEGRPCMCLAKPVLTNQASWRRRSTSTT
jgi:hypothetical protein